LPILYPVLKERDPELDTLDDPLEIEIKPFPSDEEANETPPSPLVNENLPLLPDLDKAPVR
jgi:hypothetical protein